MSEGKNTVIRNILTLGISVMLCLTLKAQISWNSPPGPPANFVLECNDATNHSEIEAYLNSLSASFLSCPDPAIISDDYSNPTDFDCGDIIIINIIAEDACGVDPDEQFTINISIDDTSIPVFDDPTGSWDATFECDGSGNVNDITNWITSIENGILVSDDCLDTTLLENSISNDWDGTGFPGCAGQINLTFTIQDGCSNMANYSVVLTLEDNTLPVFIRPATDLILVCDPASNTDDIQNWLDANGLSVFEDDCTLDPSFFTISNNWSGNVPDCNSGGTETVTFTIEDECGNSVQTQADIIINDFDPPVIDFIENNPEPVECNIEELGEGLILEILTDIINSAVGTDVNNCTDTEDLVWSFSPDPVPDLATTPDPNCEGVIAGLYEFEITLEDECGNQSAPAMVTITVQDTEPPLDPANLPGAEDYECASDVPMAPDLLAPDFCEPVPAIFDETIDDSDPCNVEISRTWIFEDACGNIAAEHEQIITVTDAQGPEWLGDMDDYLPEDMLIVVANCDEGYSFPNGYYENAAEDKEWPVYPPLAGSEYDDNCGAIFYQIGQPPTEQFPEGTTSIRFVVEDDCGNQLIHEFEVTIVCANCEGGGVVCTESCETMPGCHTCDINDLLDGFQSCTPEYLGEELNWPESLCNGEGTAHNISWFSFVAGSSDLCVEITVNECAPGRGGGPPGLQSGIYNYCEDDEGRCIGGDVSCPDIRTPISYDVSKLIVGNTYYLFVDGCDGSECDYEIRIEKGEEFILDTPAELVIEESCSQVPGFPANTYCPETVLQFDIHHEGDSPTVMGEYDQAGPYSPDIPAEFFWTFNPPIEGMTEGSWSTGEFGDGFNIPPLSFENIDEPTVFEICLTEVISDCSEVKCSDCCTEITIQPLEDEIYGPYEVCIEDLLRMEAWDPAEAGDDPNNDGIEWIGPDNINYEQVEAAITSNDGLIEFLVQDPDCGCPFMQSVEIVPIGNLEPIEVTLYMFDCQFRNQNNELDDYDWEWPEDEYDLFVNTEEELFQIFEGSEIIDWEAERCDSLIIVTVDTAIVTGFLLQGPCTPVGTEYCFELDLDRLDEEHREHPSIFPEYQEMQWYDEFGMLAHTGPCFTVTDNGVYTIQLEYEFTDGAFDEFLMIMDDCTKEFGPFDLQTGKAIQPVVIGEDKFCINDLEDKSFVISNTGEGTTYEWIFPEGAEGNLFNQPINDSITLDFTNYNFQTNAPIKLVANTACGQADTLDIFVEAFALPEARFTLESPVCVGELAEAIFIGNAFEIGEFSWSIDNYTSGNRNGAGPVNYSSTSPGTYTVSLVVIDNNGCESIPFQQSFEVLMPLETPDLDCSTSSDSIIFSWEAIDGATGYVINVLESPTTLGPFFNESDETSISFTDLSVNDLIEIEVFASGDEPCGNGPASRIECQALDCPPADWEFILWADTSFCINTPIDAFTFEIDGSGSSSFSSSVVGGVDENGNVDPLQFPVGIHTVNMTYTYQNGDCTRSQSRMIEVYPEPGAIFTPSSTEVCLGQSITIDDSGVDLLANWDYGLDGSINASGEVSWASPGIKTIEVNVRSPEVLGSCTNQYEIQVEVYDTLAFGDIDCIATDINSVHFDWESVENSTGYEISYVVNGGIVQTTTLNESEIIIDGLNPNDEVSITVTALSPNICSDVSRTSACTAIDCEPLDFSNPVCSDSGIDYVLFEWNEVQGASGFEVQLNGMPLGIQDSTSLLVEGLSPDENVFIEVTALNALGQCPDLTLTEDCFTEACQPLIFTTIVCTDAGIDFVLFEWDEVQGASGYELQLNGSPLGIQDSTSLRVEGLNPGELVVIETTALNELDQCPDVTQTNECTAEDCEVLSFANLECTDAGLEYVLFEWDEVEGAESFDIHLNGTSLGIQDSTSLMVDGLQPGEIVSIEVLALNDISLCPGISLTAECSAQPCPEQTIDFTQTIDLCYSASIGGIDLDDPVITGNQGTGTGVWNSSFVDVNDVFTPDSGSDMTYMLEYIYADGPCEYNAFFEVPISIIPEAAIDIDQDLICISETVTVESPVSTSNGETASWDFGTGVTAFGSGFGPYQLNFDFPGSYIITLTVQNDACISEPVTVSIDVDEELEEPEINCTLITSTYIQFEWNEIDNVSAYEVIIDGVSQGLQSLTEFRVSNLVEGQEVEITLNFVSENSCELDAVSLVCTSNSCPGSHFLLDSYIEEMCLDGSEHSQQLNIELIDPPDGIAEEIWLGPGVSEDGFFNPQGLSAGLVELNYNIEFEECRYDTSIFIELFDAPRITSVNPINPDCYEEDQNFGSIEPEVTGGNEPYIFMLDNGAPVSDPESFDIINPGIHTLIVTDANGCVDRIDFDIIPAVEPSLDINGALSILNIETGEYTYSTTAQNIGDVIWLADGEVICQGLDCNPVTFLGNDYDDQLELTVQIIFNEDCFLETSVRVDIEEVYDYYIPNIISPGHSNQDNSSWRMYVSSSDIIVNSVKIYDRWGNLVHDEFLGLGGDFSKAGEIMLNWDGTWSNRSNRGDEVVAGVFVYLIELQINGSRVIETGSITVVR